MKIEQIRVDGGTQPRATIDDALVTEYAEAMRGGAKFPEVVVFHDGTDHWLADGFHRVAAARKAGLDVIGADSRQGTQRDAILHSVGANANHGQRRTNADKRRAALRLLEDEVWGQWSDGVVASKCNVSQPFISGLRRDLSQNGFEITSERKVERGGTTYTQETGNIGRRTERAESEKEPDSLKFPADTDTDEKEELQKKEKMEQRKNTSRELQRIDGMIVDEIFDTIQRRFLSIKSRKKLLGAIDVLTKKLSVWSGQL